MAIEIDHLFRHPGHIRLVAEWIYREFWVGKPGVSVESLEGRLREASDPDRIPLSLLALAEGEPAGTVNLIECDWESHPHLRPWLAALLVTPAHRHRGIGSELVRALSREARRLGCRDLYLGTDIPGFCTPLGAVLHEQVTESLCIMRLPLGGERG